MSVKELERDRWYTANQLDKYQTNSSNFRPTRFCLTSSDIFYIVVGHRRKMFPKVSHWFEEEVLYFDIKDSLGTTIKLVNVKPE
jgi:hypothetical protein